MISEQYWATVTSTEAMPGVSQKHGRNVMAHLVVLIPLHHVLQRIKSEDVAFILLRSETTS